jgi:hypothetical protein
MAGLFANVEPITVLFVLFNTLSASEPAGRSGADLGSFQNVILERNALRVVFLEPSIGSDLARKDLQVIAVANLLAGVNVNPDCHWLKL